MPYHTYNHQYQQQLAYHFNSPPQLHYHYPVTVGSSATMSGYQSGNSNKKAASSSSSGHSSGRTPKHYHHNTIQLPPTIRQLNSSPQHRHVGQMFDANGNQYVQTTPTGSEQRYYKTPSPVTPITPSGQEQSTSLVDRIESVQQAPGGGFLLTFYYYQKLKRLYFSRILAFDGEQRTNLVSSRQQIC